LENKPPVGYTRISSGNYRSNAVHTQIIKFPRLGAFEVFFNKKCIFSKLKSRNWPEKGQILELIEKEIVRVTQKIPEDDKMSQSFINKRASNMIEEISKNRSSSSYEKKRRQDSAKSNYSYKRDVNSAQPTLSQLKHSIDDESRQSPEILQKLVDNSNISNDQRDSLELKKLKDQYKKNSKSPPKNEKPKAENKKRYENDSFDDDFRDNTE